MDGIGTARPRVLQKFTTTAWLTPMLAISLLVVAQTSAADTADETIDEIVVTGSRILRRDFTSPSPIATIDSETLAFSTQPTLEETLNQMPQIVPDFDRTANNPGNGTARINLRGLGAGRTLVLLNGRRFAPSGIGTAVDVNNIPQALIERVEIITGGVTTVYGSDAVAGVVNFITHDNFDGVGLDMASILDHPSATRENPLDQRRVAREDQTVQDIVAGPAIQQNMIVIEDQHIGAMIVGDGPDAQAERLLRNDLSIGGDLRLT